jgi:hypothetical protein
MDILRTVSRVFVVLTILLALYDLVNQWVTKAQMKIRTVQELWTDGISKESFEAGEKSLQSLLSHDHVHSLMQMPTPVVTAVLATFFYIIYRALLFVTGKDKSQRI